MFITKNPNTNLDIRRLISICGIIIMNNPTNISELPPELLEIIFEKISAITDIINCSKTCVKWNDLVKYMFKHKGKFTTFICLLSGVHFVHKSQKHLFNCMRLWINTWLGQTFHGFIV